MKEVDYSKLDPEIIPRISMGIRIAQRRAWLASKHHVNTNGEPLDFSSYPYLMQLYADPSEFIVAQTGAQSGKTEWLVCDCLAIISLGISCQLVEPKEDLRNMFLTTRIDQVIKLSSYYSEWVERTKSIIRWRDNPGMLRVTFSNRPDELIAYPADAICVDERDSCNMANIVQLGSRQLQSRFRIQRFTSTPILVGRQDYHNINYWYEKSDRKQWCICCVYCDTLQVFDWWDNIVDEVRNDDGVITSTRLRDRDWTERLGRDIHPICKKCGNPLDRFSPPQQVAGKGYKGSIGSWQARNPDSMVSGYHLNKMTSPRVRLQEMWDIYIRAENDPPGMQHFCNNFLGLPYQGVGDSISPDMLEACATGKPIVVDKAVSFRGLPTSMGVDVGPSTCDVRISTHPTIGVRNAIYIGKVRTFDEIEHLAKNYGVSLLCIDAEPETRKSVELQHKLSGHCLVIRVFVRDLMTAMDVLRDPDSRQKARDDGKITIDRTMTMDMVWASFSNRKNTIPKNYLLLSGRKYVTEMTTPIRVYEVSDQSGRAKFVWTAGSDHSFFADLFDLVATRLGSFGGGKSVLAHGARVTEVTTQYTGCGRDTMEQMA